MVASPDHPELPFLQANKYGRGRPDGPPLFIVVHTMEAHELGTTAEGTAQYFHNLPDGRVVSAHYCCDNNSIVQCVRLQDTAWTVGNRPGNYRGINWEFAGFAAQTAEQWRDPYSTAMLLRAVPYIRADAARFGIPLVRRTVPELQAFRPGITSHNDLRLAFGTTTHTDPGPNFPWSWFMAQLQEDDVTPEEIQDNVIKGMSRLMNAAANRADPTGRNFANWTYAVQRAADGFPTGDPDLAGAPSLSPRLTQLETQMAAMQVKLDQILAALPAGGDHTHEMNGTTGPPVL